MATTPKVYVLCDLNCKFEGMTKEQILTAIANAVSTGEIGDINTGFVQTIKTINNIPLKFFVGTQAEYNALTAEDKRNLYAIVTDDDSITNIESAIAELLENYNHLTDGLNSGSIVVNKAESANSAYYAQNANYANSASKATTAEMATNADMANFAARAENAATAGEANHATNADGATQAISALCLGNPCWSGTHTLTAGGSAIVNVSDITLTGMWLVADIAFCDTSGSAVYRVRTPQFRLLSEDATYYYALTVNDSGTNVLIGFKLSGSNLLVTRNSTTLPNATIALKAVRASSGLY